MLELFSKIIDFFKTINFNAFKDALKSNDNYDINKRYNVKEETKFDLFLEDMNEIIEEFENSLKRKK